MATSGPQSTNTGAPARLRRNRNKFREWDAVSGDPMSKNRYAELMPPVVSCPPDKPSRTPCRRTKKLITVLQKDEIRERMRWVLRDSIDEVLDGQRTGRWCYQHLTKTEKTYLGTAIQVNMEWEFDEIIEPRRRGGAKGPDWKIDGTRVDCKFSKDWGSWMIPMEMYSCKAHGDEGGKLDHMALLFWADDDSSQWAAGIIKVTDRRLAFKRGSTQRSYNRDRKRVFSKDGLSDIYWLWGGIQSDLPKNAFLEMSDKDRTRVLKDTNGQQRVNELFRTMEGKLVGRATIATVAQQKDPLKRARDARLQKHLGGQGYFILGHLKKDRDIAHKLNLPLCAEGEFVSVRVVRTKKAATGREPQFKRNGESWTRWSSEDENEPSAVLEEDPDYDYNEE